MRRVSKLFYGWWIVAGSMVALALAGAVYWQGFSIFFLPLAQEFSTSRAALSSAFSISQLEGALTGPLSGYLADRFGPRRVMLLGVGMLGLGFLLLSRVHSFLQVYLVFVLFISLGISVGIRMPTLVAPTNWFREKRGTAMGLVTSGSGLAGLFVPVLGWLVAEFGWRRAAFICGLTVWAVGLPIATLMRHRPEQYGLLPDGRTETPLTSPGQQASATTPRFPPPNAAAHTPEQGYTLGEAVRTPAFWLLSLAFGLWQLAILAVMVHLVPFLVGIGIAPQVAATVLGVTTITSIIGRLGFGWLADRMRKQLAAAIPMGLVALGAAILAHATAWWHLIFFIPIYAVGWGGGVPLTHALRGEFFGRRAFGTISGAMDAVQLFGLVGGPILAGLIFDATQSYYPAFLAAAGAAALGAGIVLLVRAPAHPPSRLHAYASTGHQR